KGIAQRVVLCKSFQLASVAIETTISHVCINEIFVGDDKTRKGCTHARMIAILMRFLVHFGVRLSNGFSEPLASFFNAGLILELSKRCAHTVNRKRRSDLPCFVPAHPIRKNEKLLFGESRPDIFIVFSNKAYIADPKAVEFVCHCGCHVLG